MSLTTVFTVSFGALSVVALVFFVLKTKVALTLTLASALAAAVYFVFYGQLEDNILAPFIYRRTAHVNPLVTLLLHVGRIGLTFHGEGIATMTPRAGVARTTSAHHRVALHAVAKDQTSAIVIAAGNGGRPAWSGAGDWDYVCGSCTALLC
ncbi:MAG TPA: hypothetical protein VFP65_11825, partial [Anaeromyxobacteraceae bacterium]|nr:hypothetical protein [Anaeromyxobacteraceae bacterium]